MTIGIILAGGIGSRFGGDKPKQYYLIHNKEMISYVIDAFKKASSIDDVIVVLDKDEFDRGRIQKEYNVKAVLGGETRNKSLKKALDYIKLNYLNCENIIINNAACPLLTPELSDQIVGLLDENDFVQCTYKITDALGSYKTRLVDREDYYLIQAPDAYRFKLLYQYFDENSPIGHPAAHLPENAKGYNYFDFIPNYKVTYPEDIRIVEMLMDRREKK